jgi:hypothetical protein
MRGKAKTNCIAMEDYINIAVCRLARIMKDMQGRQKQKRLNDNQGQMSNHQKLTGTYEHPALPFARRLTGRGVSLLSVMVGLDLRLFPLVAVPEEDAGMEAEVNVAAACLPQEAATQCALTAFGATADLLRDPTRVSSGNESSTSRSMLENTCAMSQAIVSHSLKSVATLLDGSDIASRQKIIAPMTRNIPFGPLTSHLGR